MTIEKLDPATPDLTRENIERLLELFPECRTEGPRGDAPAVDFDLLRQSLADYLVEGPAERYRLDWPGKRQALLTANSPIDKTLRPMVEDSVDFENTRNLFIEGDNLDALKLLQETYLGKVKMIYIDPPYNTGSDFIYKDNFSRSRGEYEEESGQRTEDGGRLIANTESNGRFHSDWLSMLFPRLKLARNLLSDDGVIFISIDSGELSNLRVLCDQIFGASNFLSILKWNKTSKAPTLSKKIRHKYEFVLLYEKGDCKHLRGPESYNTMAPLFNSGNQISKIVFPPKSIDFGFSDRVCSAGTYGKKDSPVLLHDEIRVVDGVNGNEAVLSARFKWSQKTVDERIKSGQRLAFKTEKFATMYYSLDNSGEKFIAPSDLLNKDECGVLRNDEGYTDLAMLFDGISPFDYAKPSSLIKYFCQMVDDPEAIIVDFFSGSSTTAQGVMEANFQDAGNRQFFMIQLPEEISEASPAWQAGYRDIASFARERIRRAGDRILKENPLLQGKVDTGFRAFRIDSGSFRDTSVTPKEATQEALAGMVSHIKDGRSDEDLLFGALLRWGVDITLPIEQRELVGRKAWLVDPPADGSSKGAALIACFARPQSGKGGIDTDLADAMAELSPLRVLFRDDGFANDATKENVHSRFQQRAPDTQVRVL